MNRQVFTDANGNAVCDIADEVEKLFGFGCTIVSIGAFGAYGSSLSVNTDFPTWRKAEEYARELFDARRESLTSYNESIRR